MGRRARGSKGRRKKMERLRGKKWEPPLGIGGRERVYKKIGEGNEGKGEENKNKK